MERVAELLQRLNDFLSLNAERDTIRWRHERGWEVFRRKTTKEILWYNPNQGEVFHMVGV